MLRPTFPPLAADILFRSRPLSLDVGYWWSCLAASVFENGTPTGSLSDTLHTQPEDAAKAAPKSVTQIGGSSGKYRFHQGSATARGVEPRNRPI